MEVGGGIYEGVPGPVALQRDIAPPIDQAAKKRNKIMHQFISSQFMTFESAILTKWTCLILPLSPASVFLIIHHSTMFRKDLFVPSELQVGLLTVHNFYHNVSKMHQPTYPELEYILIEVNENHMRSIMINLLKFL
ncbi:unnamed protein product [Fraxinus pennsylvanica]|uniref:Uncharacterized protein n=1 Tax=Fraxinus pennsylvanica TaxID=56036 RepID=A0AAD1Z944_9LAMI|nr:unnamed protein product [Fraxinus pennsylvanica]